MTQMITTQNDPRKPPVEAPPMEQPQPPTTPEIPVNPTPVEVPPVTPQPQDNPTPEGPPSTPMPQTPITNAHTQEIGGFQGLEPTRFGDWEQNGRCTDF